VWLEAGRSGGVVLALNFQGEAQVAVDGETWRRIRPGMLSWMRGVPTGVQGAFRLPGERHECLCLFYGDRWLCETLGSWRDEVPGALRSLLLEPSGRPQVLVEPLTAEDRTWARSLMAPHLCDGARQLLEGARMSEYFVKKMYESGSGASESVSRSERASKERVAKVREVLWQRYESPPALAELARLAHCNPHYLSRTFTAEEGMTISAFIRMVRIHKAAELLASGRCNVSEAAVEVGYQSLAHFTRAFAQVKGVVPSQWVRTLREGDGSPRPPRA
jgi:AraC-like DNA-binding protein